MNTEKEIIKELNIIFKKLGWKLLPENNEYPYKKVWNEIIISNTLYIDRDYIPYEKYINKFTIGQLDNYIVEFIKNICLNYKLERINFSGKGYKNNIIELK